MQCCLRGSKQHCIRENPGQYCLNTLGTKLHRSKPYAMLPQRIHRTLHKKNPVQCCLIKKPMQGCPRGSRQHCIIKNPVQCCLNTLGTILHRTKSYAILLRGSRQHCIIKNPLQCCLNTLGTILHRSKPYAMLPKSLQTHKISMCFDIWHWNFQGVQHNYAEFPGVSRVHCDKPRNFLKWFFPKSMLSTPLFGFFSGIMQCQAGWNANQN